MKLSCTLQQDCSLRNALETELSSAYSNKQVVTNLSKYLNWEKFLLR